VKGKRGGYSAMALSHVVVEQAKMAGVSAGH